MQLHQPTRGFVCVECYRDVLPDLAETCRRIFFQLPGPLDAVTVSPSSFALDVPVGSSSFSSDPSLASPGSDMVASELSSLTSPLTTGALSTPIARLPPLPPIEPLVSPRVSTRHRVCFASLPSPAPGARADVPVLVNSGVDPGTWTDARARVEPRLGVDSRDAAGDSGRHTDITTRSGTSSPPEVSLPQILTRSSMPSYLPRLARPWREKCCTTTVGWTSTAFSYGMQLHCFRTSHSRSPAHISSPVCCKTMQCVAAPHG
jgi:hypothetical protein